MRYAAVWENLVYDSSKRCFVFVLVISWCFAFTIVLLLLIPGDIPDPVSLLISSPPTTLLSNSNKACHDDLLTLHLANRSLMPGRCGSHA